VKAGSGLSTFGISSSAGVSEEVAKETIVLPLNDRRAVEVAVADYAHDIAAIIIEPVPANNGLLLQDKEFLQFLRDVTRKNNILLIFDEVISGFRVGFAGAAGYYNIQPDIITYGKIIGGGMPVGAYGANEKIMSHISPEGNVYQAGTLSGNPVAMAAGIAQLKACLKENFYGELAQKTTFFIDAIRQHCQLLPIKMGTHFQLFSIGSIFWFAFTGKEKIQSSDQIDAASMNQFTVFHRALLERGIYFGPSGYEVGFISEAHTKEDLTIAAEKISEALSVVFESEQIKSI
jgi:glutamate-1-semialdehyde 2,1-aminomutase